uniref:Caprin-1_dimer domain-containing protein n=1 Tax=Strongyloides stercoralis TaxID=6248 RepID=A0A0K0E1E5_STRER
MDSSFILDEILSQSTTNDHQQNEEGSIKNTYEERNKKEGNEKSNETIKKQLEKLEDTDEFLKKYIFGSGLFDQFVEKHLSAVSNLDTYRSRQTEPKWKVKQLIKEKFQKSKHPISKEEMKKDIAEYYLKNSVWNTKLNIAFENYRNSDDVKKEIMEMMVDQKVKLVPEGEDFQPIINALEKEKIVGSTLNSNMSRKSRFSLTIPEKNQNLSKPSVIDISTIKHVYAQVKEELKPKVLPPVNLTTSYHSYVVNYYNTPPVFNPNIPPPIIVDNIYPLPTNTVLETSSNSISSTSTPMTFSQESSKNLGPVDISDSDSDMSMDSPDKDLKDNVFNIITPPPPPPCLFDGTEDVPPPPPPSL